jgi:hypothetical protein
MGWAEDARRTVIVASRFLVKNAVLAFLIVSDSFSVGIG